MCRAEVLIGVGIITLSVVSCQPAQQCGPLSEAEVAAVEETEQAYVHGLLAGQWDSVAALFAEDAVLMGPDRPAENGRAAIRAHFEPIDSITDLTITESEIQGEGNLAYFKWAYSVTAFAAGSPNAITYTGKEVDILRKQPDGRWLIVLEIYNTDHPITAASDES